MRSCTTQSRPEAASGSEFAKVGPPNNRPRFQPQSYRLFTPHRALSQCRCYSPKRRSINYQTADKGRRIELSWEQADRIYQLTPLCLHQVISEDAAELVPAIGGDVSAIGPLHKPPYELPLVSGERLENL